MISSKLAIFASGRGSNAASIIKHFEGIPEVKIALIVSNRSKAGVLELAEENSIPTFIINRTDFAKTEEILPVLLRHDISHIVLAGFLIKIPAYLILNYPQEIINIHPALLPKYGGKGMYGRHVHEAVFQNREKESGITIHLVNENYDEGKILFQTSCKVSEDDQPEDIAASVLKLEHYHFPRVIEQWLGVSTE